MCVCCQIDRYRLLSICVVVRVFLCNTLICVYTLHGFFTWNFFYRNFGFCVFSLKKNTHTTYIGLYIYYCRISREVIYIHSYIYIFNNFLGWLLFPQYIIIDEKHVLAYKMQHFSFGSFLSYISVVPKLGQPFFRLYHVYKIVQKRLRTCSKKNDT